MSKSENQLVVPTNLPPCWWVADVYKNRSPWLRYASDTREEAEETLKSCLEWKHAKDKDLLETKVMPEDPDLRCRRWVGIYAACYVTARWNWLRRNWDLLRGWREPKPCRVLTAWPIVEDIKSDDLLGHRIGELAVLPEGTAWPTFQETGSGAANGNLDPCLEKNFYSLSGSLVRSRLHE